MFEVAGESGVEIALELCRLTWPERYWTTVVVRNMLGNRVYLGEVKSGEIVARDVIEPLVSEEVWYAAQHTGKSKLASMNYPLSGIARCAACNGPLVGNKTGRAGETKAEFRFTNKECVARVHLLSDYLEDFVGAELRANAHLFMTGRLRQSFKSLRTRERPGRQSLRATSRTRQSRRPWARKCGARDWKPGRPISRPLRRLLRPPARSGTDLPDLSAPRQPTPEDPDPGGITAEVYERCIESLTVKKGREDLAKRVQISFKSLSASSHRLRPQGAQESHVSGPLAGRKRPGCGMCLCGHGVALWPPCEKAK